MTKLESCLLQKLAGDAAFRTSDLELALSNYKYVSSSLFSYIFGITSRLLLLLLLLFRLLLLLYHHQLVFLFGLHFLPLFAIWHL